MESIQQLLQFAYDSKASDLHISVQSVPTLRIHGQLTAIGTVAVTEDVATEMAKQLLTSAQWTKLNELGEVDLGYQLDEHKRYRVNVYYQQGRVSIAARIIPGKIPSIEQLQMPSSIRQLADKPQGLVLVTGPTGSGKSSTLAALIGYMNECQSKHIITLEDPIEFVHSSKRSIVDQREVGIDTQSFSNGLRAALRQDPDVILVGELRDHETISAAITAAETGHLVLGTLHTMDAPQTIDRIIDVFPAYQQPQVRSQLAAVLLSVISQRLLPDRVGQGRRAATEILYNSPAVANLIRSEKIHQIKSVMQTGKALGMHTLDMSIKELIAQGAVDPQIARTYLVEGGI